MKKTTSLLVAVLLLCQIIPGFGQEESKKETKPIPEPKEFVTEHSGEFGGQTVDYEVVASIKLLQGELKQNGICPTKTPRCPHCESSQFLMLSAFGSTACKSLYQCKDCKMPYELFKCDLKSGSLDDQKKNHFI